MGVGASGGWTYSLYLTLEEFFIGKHCRFGIVRRSLSGKLDNVMVEFDIPPGCQPGSEIVYNGVGHELPDGTLEDLTFVLQEISHGRFIRLHDDLLLEVQIPWSETLRWQPKRVCFKGIDGEDIAVYVDYPRDKTLIGSLSVRGAGMPVRNRGKVFGRGNLIVRQVTVRFDRPDLTLPHCSWEIMPVQTRIRKFIGRFFSRHAG